MPHPPIIIPGIGGGREREAASTIEGVSRVMERIKGRRPERILLLSPHQPYALGALAINGSRLIKGGLSIYGAPEASFELRTPISGVDIVTEYLGSKDIPVAMVNSGDLDRDQGSTVPLYFLRECYGTLPEIILSSPIGLDRKMSVKMGEALASFDDGHKWALLASGDLSHRLKPGAPAGFNPIGAKFDQAVVEALKKVDPSPLYEMSLHAIEDAGECGMRSVLAMLGLVSSLGGKIDVMSYEGPYGVGYCTAVFS
jgi:aromatic ring-opening dioxygenase LigB subunit